MPISRNSPYEFLKSSKEYWRLAEELQDFLERAHAPFDLRSGRGLDFVWIGISPYFFRPLYIKNRKKTKRENIEDRNISFLMFVRALQKQQNEHEGIYIFFPNEEHPKKLTYSKQKKKFMFSEPIESLTKAPRIEDYRDTEAYHHRKKSITAGLNSTLRFRKGRELHLNDVVPQRETDDLGLMCEEVTKYYKIKQSKRPTTGQWLAHMLLGNYKYAFEDYRKAKELLNIAIDELATACADQEFEESIAKSRNELEKEAQEVYGRLEARIAVEGEAPDITEEEKENAHKMVECYTVAHMLTDDRFKKISADRLFEPAVALREKAAARAEVLKHIELAANGDVSEKEKANIWLGRVNYLGFYKLLELSDQKLRKTDFYYFDRMNGDDSKHLDVIADAVLSLAYTNGAGVRINDYLKSIGEAVDPAVDYKMQKQSAVCSCVKKFCENIKLLSGDIDALNNTVQSYVELVAFSGISRSGQRPFSLVDSSDVAEVLPDFKNEKVYNALLNRSPKALIALIQRGDLKTVFPNSPKLLVLHKSLLNESDRRAIQNQLQM